MKVMKFRLEMFFFHELHVLHGKLVFLFINHPFTTITEEHEEHEEKQRILDSYWIKVLTSSIKN